MKKLILLITGLLLSVTAVNATHNHTENVTYLDITKRYRYAQPIMFVERGVEFLIFPDGSFDFNSNANNGTYEDTYYRTASKRSRVNTTYGAPGRTVAFTSNYNRGVSISHDRDGKVRRIGNVYLNYDRFGKIKRAGSVYMDYKRGKGTLTQVGGLRVNYNHWGEIVSIRGQVNRYDDNCNICGTASCSMDHSHGGGQHNDRNNDRYDDGVYQNDDNYYYFKQNGKVKKQKKNKR